MNSTNTAGIETVKQYFEALRTGNLALLGSLFADDVIWHQPGSGKLSGTHRGKKAVFDLFGQFVEISGGSFKIDQVSSIMGNGSQVAAVLHFSARKKSGESISMDGVDLMRIENGKIAEVYLFSGDQAAEDRFWN